MKRKPYKREQCHCEPVKKRVLAVLGRKAEWGVVEPWAHLAFVTLAVFLAIPLLYWDGGYAGAASFQRWLGVAALGYVLYAYLVRPLLARSACTGGAP